MARARWQIAADRAIYFLSTERKPIGEESIDSVRHKLRGQDARLFPWITPIDAMVLGEGGVELASFKLYGLSVDAQTMEELQLTPSPSWGDSGASRDIMLPADIPTAGEQVWLRIVNDQETLTFPVTPAPTRLMQDNIALVPAKLAGILKLFQYRTIQYDKDLEAFVVSRRGYAAFRLYAKTIDDVDGLRQFFDGQAIPVHTEAKRIQEVQDLDTVSDADLLVDCRRRRARRSDGAPGQPICRCGAEEA